MRTVTTKEEIATAVEDLKKDIKEKAEDMKKSVRAILLRGALQIERDAKIALYQWPAIKTGTLARSITHEEKFAMNEQFFFIGTKVKYSKFVEFGTKKMRPRPYLLPAYEKNRKQIIDEIKEFLKNEKN